MNEIGALKAKVQNGIERLNEMIEELQNNENEKKKDEVKKRNSSIEQYLERMKDLKIDSDNFESNFLLLVETLMSEPIDVHVFGIELEYPKLFTCLLGHELEYLFNKIFGVECKAMIEAFTDTGIFVPNELISIFKNIGQNIVQLSDTTFEELVQKGPYRNYAWFVRYKSTAQAEEFDEEFKR